MSSVIIQIATDVPTQFPEEQMIVMWGEAVLTSEQQPGEMTIRFVDMAEGQELNKTFRKQSHATNVLAFTGDQDLLPNESPYRGDVVVCLPIAIQESQEKNLTLPTHLAHLCIHGTLHLLGYDHELEEDAHRMEHKEIELLAHFGFSNPYNEELFDEKS